MKNKMKGTVQLISAFVVPIILFNVCPLIGSIVGMIVELVVTGSVDDFSGYFWVGAIVGWIIGIVASIVCFLHFLKKRGN